MWGLVLGVVPRRDRETEDKVCLLILTTRGGGGWAPKGWVHNLQFFALGSSKIEVFKTYFSDTVIT